jgi:hypothetical protein
MLCSKREKDENLIATLETAVEIRNVLDDYSVLN